MRILRYAVGLGIAILGAGCATGDRDHVMLISVPEQKMTLVTKGEVSAQYPISTSKYGLSDKPYSYGTPVGKMEVAEKFGSGVRPGTVFKNRQPTREVVSPNAKGRDPIVSRILWLKGDEAKTRNAYARFIYIHGTAEEWRLGTPASYGCIRMRSVDVIELFAVVGIGARVEVENLSTDKMLQGNLTADLAHQN